MDQPSEGAMHADVRRSISAAARPPRRQAAVHTPSKLCARAPLATGLRNLNADHEPLSAKPKASKRCAPGRRP